VFVAVVDRRPKREPGHYPELRVEIDRSFPFAEAAAAHEYIESTAGGPFS
jgi:hypothetical protein